MLGWLSQVCCPSHLACLVWSSVRAAPYSVAAFCHSLALSTPCPRANEDLFSVLKLGAHWEGVGGVLIWGISLLETVLRVCCDVFTTEQQFSTWAVRRPVAIYSICAEGTKWWIDNHICHISTLNFRVTNLKKFDGDMWSVIPGTVVVSVIKSLSLKPLIEISINFLNICGRNSRSSFVAPLGYLFFESTVLSHLLTVSPLFFSFSVSWSFFPPLRVSSFLRFLSSLSFPLLRLLYSSFLCLWFIPFKSIICLAHLII